jgi:hypothetical protein
MLKAGTPLLLTNTLAGRLTWLDPAAQQAFQTLEVPPDGWSLMTLPAEKLLVIRNRMLKPFGLRLDAPSRVALYLLGEDVLILENFNPHPVKVNLAVEAAPPTVLLNIGSVQVAAERREETGLQMPPHSLVALGIR